MNTLFLANAGGAAGNNWMMIILFIILIGFTYFGMIRPQKKQQQQRLQMMDKLKKGDNVILVDGLHAKIDKINDDKTVVVDADGIYLTFERMAIRRVLPATKVEEAPADTTETTETKPADETKSTEDTKAEDVKDSSTEETKEDK
ncbi:preprotein translocase subunit YajC [uncultured Lactobacillus sp.]|uniref:preprotein translocase subunit YajC n=1 Tax=uncultured Lactobacillus sp. TaxID=153152 RepID=UPI002805D7CE|nr:preprotein translocase subunit YajC [uncultured Lactobacillus sp.]